MNATTALTIALLATVLLQRLIELFVSARNQANLLRSGARLVPRDGFFGIAIAQTLTYAGVALEVYHRTAAGVGPWTSPFLTLALLATALRYWAAVSLGRRYVVRVVVAPTPLVAHGPYARMRHPIYRAVAIEVAAIALALGCWTTAIVGTGFHILALRRRIRIEEEALRPTTPTV